MIRHVGRTSRKSYETPVGVYLDDGAIYIALPYGPKTDWIKNLAAAGGGEVGQVRASSRRRVAGGGLPPEVPL